MKKSIVIVLACAWLLLVTVLLSLPGSDLPQEDWLDRIWFDKWVHIGLFGTLVFIFCFAWKDYGGKKIRLFLLVAAAAVAYGIAMEFVQKYFVPGRSFDPGDIVADFVGSGLGLLIVTRRYIKK